MNKVILITCLTITSCANNFNLTNQVKMKEICENCNRLASIYKNKCTICGEDQGTRFTPKRCIKCNGEETITCTKCNGLGELTTKKKTTTSNMIGTKTAIGGQHSSTVEICSRCDGDKKIECPTCDGIGTIYGPN